ncbi:acetylcholinesterase-like protein [Dinothrombium tinctorium]|uniref:Acetylcholinesterase-like protein n=1 Tax=Dinothrombium tinctorium TaxID=1965070 RepID=A0A443R7M2_9ACAR|nr:acetylcholinesterase-like protein [Dinothrombium tinctorium]
MTEFGPNKTKGQYFCLRITLLLLRKVLHYVTTNDTTSGLTFQHSNSVRCSLVAGEANTADDAQSNGKTVIVETATGKVEGVKRKVFGSDLNIFIGIPYAEPPIGDLRFKRTVPVKPWSDTMKTTAFHPNFVVSAYYSNTGTTAQQLSEILGCVSSYGTNEDEDENDNIDMLPVHKEPQKEQIATNATLSFTPSPYEEFLPIMPTDAIKEKIVGESFSNIHEVLMGLTKDEASVFLHLHAPQIFTEHNVTIDFNSIEELHDLFIEIVVKRNVPLSQAQILASTFLRPDSPEKDNVKRLYTALSDLAFNCPATIFAQELAKSNKTVYFYIFNHRLSGVPQIADWMGVPHLTLMPFVFGYPLRYPTRFSGADIEVSKRIMKAWTKFAESGKMPPQSGVEWKKFSLENQEYLEITERTSTLKEKYHEKSCELFKVGFDTLESK